MVVTTANTYYRSVSSFCLVLCITIAPAFAIDNPDSPDLIGAFKARASVFETAVNNPRNSNLATLIAYDKYQTFLEKELHQVYELLVPLFQKEQQSQLKEAQRRWLKFRDTEFELIKNNWTRANFGSSSGMSRGAYRCSLIQSRILQLLHYAKNY